VLYRLLDWRQELDYQGQLHDLGGDRPSGDDDQQESDMGTDDGGEQTAAVQR
jgi:hypothetical protein